MRRRGSITVFASLVIMLVANFLFALLEASRYTELSKVAEMRANADIESVFSQYCIPLYENYGLLGYDCQGTNVEWFLKDLSEAGLAESKDLFWKKRLDLLRLSMDSADVSSYTLITDGDGAVYEASVAAYMRSDVWNLHLINLVVPANHTVKSVFPMHSHQRHTVFIEEKESAVPRYHLFNLILEIIQSVLTDESAKSLSHIE